LLRGWLLFVDFIASSNVWEVGF